MNTVFRVMLVICSLFLSSTGAIAADKADGSDSMMQNGKMQSGMKPDMMKSDMMKSDMAKSDMMKSDMMKSDMMGHGMMTSDMYSDKAFLSAMIPHHEAAVVMAKDVLAKGKDAQVKKWANDVIASQQAEIVQMNAWLKSLGGVDKKAADAMNSSMHAMMTSPMDKDADRNFVAMMVGHHASALEMSTSALVRSDDAKIIALANQIIAAQAKEIMEYRQWLVKNKM